MLVVASLAIATVWFGFFVVLGERIPALEPHRPAFDANISLDGTDVLADITTDLPDGTRVHLSVIEPAQGVDVEATEAVQDGRVLLRVSLADARPGSINALVNVFPEDLGSGDVYGLRGEGLSGPHVAVDTGGVRYIGVSETLELRSPN